MVFFSSLAELCERLEATESHFRMIDLVIDFLASLESEEVKPAVSMILGRPCPRWSDLKLDVDWATIRRVLDQVFHVDWSVFDNPLLQKLDSPLQVPQISTMPTRGNPFEEFIFPTSTPTLTPSVLTPSQ